MSHTRFAPAKIVGLSLVMAACGDSPTAPSSTAQPRFTMAMGHYTLTIAVTPLSASVPRNPCLEITSAADRAAIPVSVERMADSWQVRPIAAADLGLMATLQSPEPNTLIGPVQGQARDPQTGVTVTISDPPAIPGFPALGPATLFGSLERPDVSTGVVNGQVRFNLGLEGRTCSVNEWRLEPR
jgi:hypothetical protein